MKQDFFYENIAPELPSTPGCYMFLDIDGNVLYVGKSKCLKKRVASYFGNIKYEKLRLMTRFANNIIIEETMTDIEALLLEHKLIKKHRPQYNAKMRKDYQNWYIRFDEGILLTLDTDSRGFFVGPFSRKEMAMEALEVLGRCFKLPTCNRISDQVSRMCLRGHINNCFAPCENKDSGVENYQTAICFLQGRNNKILDRIGKKMQSSIKNKEFEKAAEHRMQYEELKQLLAYAVNATPVLAKKRFVVFLKSRHEDCFMLALLDDEKCIERVLVNGLHESEKIHDFARAVLSTKTTSCRRVSQKPSKGLFVSSEENKAFVRALIEISAIRRFFEIEPEFTCAEALANLIEEMII